MSSDPFGSSSSDPFAGGSKSATYRANVARGVAKKGHHSLLGNILGGVENVAGNAVHEARDMAVGSATGTVDLIEHPSHLPDFAHAIVTDYKTRYGRLLHGDFSDLEKHPLSYILDAATIASGGIGGLSKLGRLATTADAAAGGSKVAKLFHEGALAHKGGEATLTRDVKVHLSANPYKRARERTYLAIEKKLPANTPVVGVNKRASRTLTHEQRDYEARLRSSRPAYVRATKGFTEPQMTALDAAVRGWKPSHELAFLRHYHRSNGTAVPAEAIRRLGSVQANELFHRVVLTRKGRLAPTKDTQKIIDAYETHAKLANETSARLVASKQLDPKTLETRAVLHHVLARSEMSRELPNTVDELAHEIESETGFKPVYTPDTLTYKVTSKGNKTNAGTLFLGGTRAPALAGIVDRHEAASRLLGAEAAKQRIAKMARKVPEGTDKRPDEVWLADNIKSKSWLADNIHRFEEEGRVLKDTGSPAAAFEHSLIQTTRPEHGLAVPRSAVQDIVDQRARTIGTVSDMLAVGTNLWKKIILGMRPAFVTGNFAGNQLLYHLRNGIGAKALARTRREAPSLEKHFAAHGRDYTLGATEMLPDKGITNKAANVFFHAVATHEHVLRVATMIRQARKIPQFRAIEKATARGVKNGDLKLQKGASIFSTSLDQAIEKHPWIRHEVGQVIDDTMGNYRYYNRFERGLKQIVPFYGWNRHAMRSYARLLQDRPALADAIMHLGAYGNKHNAAQFPGVPEFMQSYAQIPALKKLGLGSVIDTRPLNPLSTGGDTINAIDQLYHMKPGHMDAVASNLNPILTALIQTAVNQNLTTGAPIPHSSLESLPGGSVLSQLVLGLPQVKLAEHLRGNDVPAADDYSAHYTPTGRPKKPSQHMLGRSNADLIAGLLGVPSRDVNLNVAQTLQKKLKTQAGGPHYASPRKPRKKRFNPNNPFG